MARKMSIKDVERFKKNLQDIECALRRLNITLARRKEQIELEGMLAERKLSRESKGSVRQ